MNFPSTASKLDFLGVTTSLLCAVHCVGIPILLSLTAWSQLVFFLDPVIENTVLSVSAVIGIASLSPSYFRCHKRLHAIYLLITGFALIGTGRLVLHDTAEVILTSSGALLVAFAHYTNWKLCKSCRK